MVLHRNNHQPVTIPRLDKGLSQGALQHYALCCGPSSASRHLSKVLGPMGMPRYACLFVVSTQELPPFVGYFSLVSICFQLKSYVRYFKFSLVIGYTKCASYHLDSQWLRNTDCPIVAPRCYGVPTLVHHSSLALVFVTHTLTRTCSTTNLTVVGVLDLPGEGDSVASFVAGSRANADLAVRDVGVGPEKRAYLVFPWELWVKSTQLFGLRLALACFPVGIVGKW